MSPSDVAAAAMPSPDHSSSAALNLAPADETPSPTIALFLGLGQGDAILVEDLPSKQAAGGSNPLSRSTLNKMNGA